MRTLIGSCALLFGLCVVGCAAESAPPDEPDAVQRLFDEPVNSSDRPDPAPFAEDRDVLPTTPERKLAAAADDTSIESPDARHLEAHGGR